MQRAKHYAQMCAAVFLLLTVITLIMLVTSSAREFFLGPLHSAPIVLVVLAFFSAGAALLTRNEWGYYWALAVGLGFFSGGLAQLVAMERAGIPTLLVGGLLLAALRRASKWFPPNPRSRLRALVHDENNIVFRDRVTV